MDINFELYKIFYYTAKYQSFSDAAQALYITQPAVSQAVKSLEEKTGVKLFFRRTRNVKLTSEGEMLYKHIGQAYNFIKAGENKLHEMHNLASGEIRIGVSDTICKYYLIPYLEKFNNIYPRIKIQVINRTSSQILTILKNGLIDLGVITLPLSDKGFKFKDFIAVEDIFVASGKFSELKNRPVPLNEIIKFPLLMLQKNSATRRNIDNYFKEMNIEIAPEIELESIDLLVEFAKIGLGIAHVLRESAASAIRGGELFEIKPADKLPVRKLGIVTLDNVPLSRTSEEFVRLLSV